MSEEFISGKTVLFANPWNLLKDYEDLQGGMLKQHKSECLISET
jgi:hypothetical protein